MTDEIADSRLPPLRDVIRDYGLGARKSLGQHFLLDGNLVDRIARAGGDLDHANVIEVGPGPGGLTRALLRQEAKAVWAVEKDDRCLEAMADLKVRYPDRLHVIAADATKTDIVAMVPAPRIIVANLPYNVSTVLLLQWLAQAHAFERMVLMFQKEVADRLVAEPGTKAYGRLSVITQWLCETRQLFNVSKEAFTPPPKVTSTVVELIPRKEPLAQARFETLEKVAQAAFGQRRKMLRSSLKQIGLDPAAANVNPTARAEELRIEEFCALARVYDAQPE